MISKKFDRWGIIGDGQLARMLALAAYPLGIRPILLTSDANSSAGQVCPLQVRGSIKSSTDLHALLSQVDGAIIESEFVNCDTLEATGLSHKIFPSIAAIRTLQNKLEQKKLLKNLGILTSRMMEQNSIRSLWLDEIFSDSTPPMVLKFATQGYDGKGVCVLGKSEEDRARAIKFLDLASERKIEVFAEEKIDFKKEVAMIAVRSRSGALFCYPLVVSEQKEGVCHLVFGPATSADVKPELESSAQNTCKKIAEHLNLTGTFAVEFFVTKEDQILVNEIAPRVHNSGHYTQNILGSSQFTNHWQSIVNDLIDRPIFPEFFAMQNFLGPKGVLEKASAPVPTSLDAVSVHWYGKGGISPGRKLGHANIACKDIKDKDAALNKLNQVHENWQKMTTEKIPLSNMELPG